MFQRDGLELPRALLLKTGASGGVQPSSRHVGTFAAPVPAYRIQPSTMDTTYSGGHCNMYVISVQAEVYLARLLRRLVVCAVPGSGRIKS